MRQFLKILVKGVLGLTAATAMVAVVQAQAAPIPDRAGDSGSVTRGGGLGDRDGVQEWPGVVAPSGAFLLAQNVEPPKEKSVSPASSPKKAKARRSMPPPPQMERSAPGSPMIPDEPERSGTKKIGGQTIRAKETPGGE
jgi:hypothetical protein